MREKRLAHECKKDFFIVNADNSIATIPPYEIRIPALYPFSSPKVFRYGNDVIIPLSKLFIKHKEFIDLYKIKLECICCASITCAWSPCNKIMEAVNEIKNYSVLLRSIDKCVYLFPKLPFDDNICFCIVQYLV